MNSTQNKTEGSNRLEDALAAAILGSTSLFGLLLAIATGVAFYRLRQTLTPSFSVLMLSLTVSDTLCIGPMALWATPMTWLQDYALSTQTAIGRRMGQMADLGWFCSQYLVVLLALNRLLAVGTPLLYRKVFTVPNTLAMCAACYVLGAGISFHDWLDLVLGSAYRCNMVYYPGDYSWYYLDGTPWCSDVAIQIGWYSNTVSSLLMLFLLLGTLFLIRKSLGENAAARNLERKLARVSALNIVIFWASGFCFSLSWQPTSSKWLVFLLTNWFWCFCHMSNSLASFFMVDKLRAQILAMVGLRCTKKQVDAAGVSASGIDGGTALHSVQPRRSIVHIPPDADQSVTRC